MKFMNLRKSVAQGERSLLPTKKAGEKEMQAGTSSRKESNEAEKQRIAQYTNELIRADANKALGRTEPTRIFVRGVGNWEDCSLFIVDKRI